MANTYRDRERYLAAATIYRAVFEEVDAEGGFEPRWLDCQHIRVDNGHQCRCFDCLIGPWNRKPTNPASGVGVANLKLVAHTECCSAASVRVAFGRFGEGQTLIHSQRG